MNSIIEDKFENSIIISNEYIKLLENINYYLKNPKKLKYFGEKISKLILLEDKDYEELDLSEIEYYLSIIKSTDKNYPRIVARLINKKELFMLDESDDDSKTTDTIEGIIHLKGAKRADNEIFKVMERKDFSESDKRACSILFSSNLISLISISSINLFAENLLINCNCDMDILFDIIDKYNINDISYDKKIEFIIRKINSMIAINNREYQNIYFLLLCKEEINLLLESADTLMLTTVKKVINTLKLNNCNVEAFNNIKRKIRQKEEELS